MRHALAPLSVLGFVLCLCAATSAGAATMQDTSLRLANGSVLPYGLLVPDDYKAGRARPLVLALHPGGGRMLYYGSAYASAVVVPALGTLAPIVIAPDCPKGSWADADAEAAVMALVERTLQTFTIDRRRILVVGYSMGGRGTWFMASRHQTLFTAAIPMAASIGDDPPDTLATMPTYIIHSRQDEVVPFAPAEANARALSQLGRPVVFDALDTPTHFQMTAYVPALGRAVAWVTAQWNARR